jgi:hypothetical protein
VCDELVEVVAFGRKLHHAEHATAGRGIESLHALRSAVIWETGGIVTSPQEGDA